MLIRFLATTVSDHPEVPFQAGQIIRVPGMTSAMRAWLVSGVAMIWPERAEESATLGPPTEVAMLSRPRRKGHR